MPPRTPRQPRRVAILSAGRSLRQTYDPREPFDVCIGVNAAAAIFHCDWWSCGDGETFARVKAIGFPVVFTLDVDDGHYRIPAAAKRLKKHRVVAWSELRGRTDAPPTWTDWSISAAVALAVDLGAEEIHVFGHDGHGTVDVSGHELAIRAGNWPRVNASWAAMVSWARARGVSVIEVQP